MSEAILAKGNRPVDLEPTIGSSNLITSGAVAEALENAGSTEVYIGKDTPKGDEVLWFNTNTNTNINSRVINTSTSYVLLNDAIIYVSNSGNDSTGNGTFESPFASINHVIAILPKNLNGFNVTIKIIGENEIFNEAIKLSGFYGGELVFSGSEFENNVSNCKFSKISVNSCTLVRFLNMNLTINGLTQSNSNVYIENSKLNVTDATTGIMLKAVSHFITDEKSIIDIGSCVTAINTMELSKMYIYNITGGATNSSTTEDGTIVTVPVVVDGIIADSGSAVNITSSSLIAGTLYSTSSGGTISINAQPTIAN